MTDTEFLLHANRKSCILLIGYIANDLSDPNHPNYPFNTFCN